VVGTFFRTEKKNILNSFAKTKKCIRTKKGVGALRIILPANRGNKRWNVEYTWAGGDAQKTGKIHFKKVGSPDQKYSEGGTRPRTEKKFETFFLAPLIFLFSSQRGEEEEAGGKRKIRGINS